MIPIVEILLYLQIASAVLCICFYKLEYGMALLIFSSPFYLQIKPILPSFVNFLWRDLFLLIILFTWYMKVTVRKEHIKFNPITIVVLTYVLWGLIEIFNSTTLLHGLCGFRTTFYCALTYFVCFSTIKSEREIKIYLNSMLASIAIVAAIGIVQFILVNFHIIDVGNLMSLYWGREFYKPGVFRFRFFRAISVFTDPNDLGTTAALGASVLLPFSLLGKKDLLRICVIFLFIIFLSAVILSNSRSSMLGFSLAALFMMLLVARYFKLKNYILSLVGIIIGIFWTISRYFGYFQKSFLPIFWGTSHYQQAFPERLSNVLDVIRGNPLLGTGFSVTKSIAKKFGITTGTFNLSCYDFGQVMILGQFGLIGLLLYVTVHVVPLVTLYRNVRSPYLPAYCKKVSIGIFGAIICILITSIHYLAFYCVGTDINFWILLAIGSWIYSMQHRQRLSDDGMEKV